MTPSLLDAIEINPEQSPVASVIWLHGLGADGNDFVPVVRQLSLNFPIRFIFPHAPVLPVTINGGYVMPAWYDILGGDASTREDEKGVRASSAEINKLIEQQENSGLPSERIFLAGFSQGGAIALQCGLRYPKPLAGILALSTYLPLRDTLITEASVSNKDTPIFMAHGLQDNVLPLIWAKMSCELLEKLHYPIEFFTYTMTHTVCAEEINAISQWLNKILGEK
jgi:phospholipase/carboxylesterase